MKALVTALSRLNIIAYFNLHAELNLSSTQFYIPLMRGLGVQHLDMADNWALSIIKVLATVKGGAFIDIGAGVGRSLLWLRAVDKDIDYVGFDSDLHCADYIGEMIKRNGFAGAQVFPFGISGVTDRAGRLEPQYYHECAVYNWRLFDEDFEVDKEGSLDNAVRTVFFYIRKNIIPEEVGIIKVGVEEHGLFVFQGIQGLIKKKRPTLLLGILAGTCGESTGWLARRSIINDFLKESQYRLYKTVKDAKGDLNCLKLLGSIPSHPDTAVADYAMVPAELETRFIQVSTEMGYIPKAAACDSKQNTSTVLAVLSVSR